MKKREEYVSVAAQNAANRHEEKTGHYTMTMYDDNNCADGVCCYNCDWMRYNVQPRKTIGDYAKEREVKERKPLDKDSCYYPNAAKLLPLGFSVDGFDSLGRRSYIQDKVQIAVDDYRTGEVAIWCEIVNKEDGSAFVKAGRVFSGLLPSESFFNELLKSVYANFNQASPLCTT